MIMSFANIFFKIKSANINNIEDHLTECSHLFIPPLDTYIDIKRYSKKLFSNAITFEAWDDGKLIGLIAIYLNDFDSKIGFITNVSIAENYLGCGLATELIKRSIEFSRGEKIKKISLEVNRNNNKAISLYKKCGFCINKDVLIDNKNIKMDYLIDDYILGEA